MSSWLLKNCLYFLLKIERASLQNGHMLPKWSTSDPQEFINCTSYRVVAKQSSHGSKVVTSCLHKSAKVKPSGCRVVK